MDNLTDTQLDELERLEREATPCTAWEAGKYTIGASGRDWCWELYGDNNLAAEDAACFAAARNALPALIAEVRRLRERVLEHEGVIAELTCDLEGAEERLRSFEIL